MVLVEIGMNRPGSIRRRNQKLDANYKKKIKGWLLLQPQEFLQVYLYHRPS